MESCWFNIVSLLIGLIGTGGTIFLVWKSCQKPKARLHLADGTDEITFSPHYYRPIAHKYYTDPITNCYASHRYSDLVEKYNDLHKKDNVFVLSFRLTNIGKLQLEYYKIEIEFNGGIKNISIPIEPVPFMSSWEEKPAPQDLKLNVAKKPQIVYSPIDRLPLNQNDHKDFALLFTPQEDVEKIGLSWRIIAKDFSDYGKFVIHLKPTITRYTEIHFANCERDIPEGAEKIDDLTPYIKEFEELLKQ